MKKCKRCMYENLLGSQEPCIDCVVYDKFETKTSCHGCLDIDENLFEGNCSNCKSYDKYRASSTKPYFMVHGKGATSVKHEKEDSAMAEAEKLSKLNPGVKFFVLRTVSFYETKLSPTHFEVLK